MKSLVHKHKPKLSPNQCGSSVVQIIDAPLALVWSVVRRFDCPQAYKGFIKDCTLKAGDGGVGSVREVVVISGLPGANSTERLDQLDEEKHVMMFSIIGGEHKLRNYRSTISLHEDCDRDTNGGGGGGKRTVVVESYAVDVPAGSSKEDTCLFADTIIRCNLKSLAKVTEKMASCNFEEE